MTEPQRDAPDGVGWRSLTCLTRLQTSSVSYADSFPKGEAYIKRDAGDVVPYKHIGKNIVILTKISPATINVHKIPYERNSAVVNLSIVGVDVLGDP